MKMQTNAVLIPILLDGSEQSNISHCFWFSSSSLSSCVQELHVSGFHLESQGPRGEENEPGCMNDCPLDAIYPLHTVLYLEWCVCVFVHL